MNLRTAFNIVAPRAIAKRRLPRIAYDFFEIPRSGMDRVMVLIGCNSIGELGPESLSFETQPAFDHSVARQSHA